MIYSDIIDVKYLKDNSPILQYVNDDELKVFIKPAQDIYIQRALGTKLYYSLMQKIDVDILSSDEINLINMYILPTLTWFVTYEFALYANYKFTNKAISKQSSDNSQPAELSEVNYISSNIKSKADSFMNTLTNHLIENYTIFPEYYEVYGKGIENVVSKRDNYFGGIYLGTTSEECRLRNIWSDNRN